LVLAAGEVPDKVAGTPPPEGFGPLPQEAVVRDVITDTITDTKSQELVSRKGRNALKAKLLKSLRARTDVKVKDVLFTDVAVQ
jgi:flagellar FliL protein